MGTTANFDLTQTAFLFNWISNSSCLEKGTEQQLADFVYCALLGPDEAHPSPFSNLQLPGLLPTLGSELWGGVGNGWQLVWGPGVYEIDKNSGKADNTAFVVYSAAFDTYVVAIAGTDPHAFWDWMKEDFQVGPNDCVNWQGFDPTAAQPPGHGSADPQTAQISLGTALGLWALAGQLKQSQWSPAPSQTLAQFLSQGITVTPGQTQIIFTGHSLGGALSPTLANWARGLSRLAKVALYALPTAGPTPGNGCYQTDTANPAAWDTVFPQTAVSALNHGGSTNPGNVAINLNCDVWHTDDVVPHAWEYIYTTTSEATTPAADRHYFNGLLPVALATPLGELLFGTGIRQIASSRQAVADEAYMTRSGHTQPFSMPNANQGWPMLYYDKGTLTSLADPRHNYTDDLTFLGVLGTIHCWAYGTAAFNIDFSVFTAIHPKSVTAVAVAST